MATCPLLRGSFGVSTIRGSIAVEAACTRDMYVCVYDVHTYVCVYDVHMYVCVYDVHTYVREEVFYEIEIKDLMHVCISKHCLA